MNTIKLGSKGPDVKQLQKYLKIWADGVFGTTTDKKVKEWQKTHGLTPDGIVGPKTWATFETTSTNNSTLSIPLNKKLPSNIGISAGMINFICKYETGKQYGYPMSGKDLTGYDLKDAKGHLTYGYGILYHPLLNKYMDEVKKIWTQKELEELFLVHAKNTAAKIDKWAITNKVKLNQNQKDAIASAYYNFGPNFLKKQICKTIIANPNNPAIRSAWEHLSDAQGAKYPGLIKRRQAEARWYFEGK